MLAGHTKIQKHKAQIQQRISELQNKLREPNRENHASNKKVDEEQLPYRRAYAQQAVYVEPKEVTALRERQLNARQSRNRRSQAPSISDPQLFIPDNYMKSSQRVSHERTWNKEPEQREVFHPLNGQQIYYPKRQERNSIGRDRQSSQQNNELYGLMEQILNNQRNLQKQIGLLRSEWVREQNLKKEERLAETINSKSKFNQVKANPIISFQQPESVERAELFEIFSKKPNQQHKRRESKRKPNQTSDSFRNIPAKKNQHSYEQETFGVNSPNLEAKISENMLSSSQIAKENRLSTAQKNRKSGKKAQQDQIHQKLSTLIKTQKGKNQRLIVSQRCKTQFWKQVQGRIIASENEYKQSVHRNNKHEQEHLINTNELQKKLKEDLVSKVYSQSNNCLYK